MSLMASSSSSTDDFFRYSLLPTVLPLTCALAFWKWSIRLVVPWMRA